MAIISNYLKTRVVRYPLLGFFAFTASVGTGLYFDLSKSDASSWVQAVGVTLGIGIAIWVPWKQNRDARKADQEKAQEQVCRIRVAIADELQGYASDFAFPSLYHDYLVSKSEEMIFDWELPVEEPYLPIYTAMCSQLPLIDDGHLRTQVIAAYRSITNFTSQMRENNRLLAELHRLDANCDLQNNGPQQVKRQVIHRALQSNCRRMRDTRLEAPTRAASIAEQLRQHI